MFDIQLHEADNPIARLILAHGAGAGMQHPFMQTIASKLSKQGVEVVLFNFPYMQVMTKTGKRRPPAKAETLLGEYKDIVAHISASYADLATFIGGKSMGGRIASMLVDELENVQGVVALGYPFHPAGKPEKTRTAHLQTITTPMLVVQGERDALGSQHEVERYSLSSRITTYFLADGDHSLKPRKKSGFSEAQHLTHAAKLITDFIKEHTVS
ncbi:alpha/beta hydrolase [Alteromonas sp. 345S023]|uniref:Alpha/beta hydrolase n=1 Tax=Alteromonas profundi TaxID=2696062 RepID=A0A7X5RKT7_9ALTE|nr:alpha/beta family hydrolase [Alteromonas profundi]NDV91051.1 alpha/beta hydrolase [Alteromonas profundi]